MPKSSDSVLRRDKKRKGPHEDRGRDGKDAARSPGMPTFAGSIRSWKRQQGLLPWSL